MIPRYRSDLVYVNRVWRIIAAVILCFVVVALYSLSAMLDAKVAKQDRQFYCDKVASGQWQPYKPNHKELCHVASNELSSH